MESKNLNFNEDLYMTDLAYKNRIEGLMLKDKMKYRMMQNNVDLALSISNSRG